MQGCNALFNGVRYQEASRFWFGCFGKGDLGVEHKKCNYISGILWLLLFIIFSFPLSLSVNSSFYFVIIPNFKHIFHLI